MGRTPNEAVPKGALQSDPLRPHVTRVEKPWRQRSTRPGFPAWYRRICGTTWHRDTRPEDYDEDLSELEPQKEEDECQCDNENEEECDCYIEDDVESERTYDGGGTDVEEYYMTKDERNDRKRELQQRRRRKDVEKEHQIQVQKVKEDEVHAAWCEFKKTRRSTVDWNQTIPLPSIVNQRFKLFSADHADRLYSKLCAPYFPSKEVHFFYMCKDEDRGRLGRLYGEVHFDTCGDCHFGPFRLPTCARRRTVKIKSSDDRYDLWFKFFSKDYLNLSVSRDLIFQSDPRLETKQTAPEMMEFVGSLRSPERDNQDKEEEDKWEAQNRPPSPRESFFEMSHSMGWWAESMSLF